MKSNIANLDNESELLEEICRMLLDNDTDRMQDLDSISKEGDEVYVTINRREHSVHKGIVTYRRFARHYLKPVKGEDEKHVKKLIGIPHQLATSKSYSGDGLEELMRKKDEGLGQRLRMAGQKDESIMDVSVFNLPFPPYDLRPVVRIRRRRNVNVQYFFIASESIYRRVDT